MDVEALQCLCRQVWAMRELGKETDTGTIEEMDESGRP